MERKRNRFSILALVHWRCPPDTQRAYLELKRKPLLNTVDKNKTTGTEEKGIEPTPKHQRWETGAPNFSLSLKAP